MSAEVINHSPDLKRLQDEGYELEVKQGHAIIYNIPYLDSNLQLQMGTMVSPLNMSGETAKYPNTGNAHVINFSGSYPYRSNGEQLRQIVLSESRQMIVGINTDYMFSNKPSGGYNDYYQKFKNYIDILVNEAKALYSDVTPKTFKRIVSKDDDVFVYSDTNASRAAISNISDKFRDQKIAIVGLGGTGSYILDQVAKTPVLEIHLFDGDKFCQHNAFRSPGAADVNTIKNSVYKTDYHTSIYKNMHKKIVSHPYYLEEANIDELSEATFVFIAIDSSDAKKSIIDFLFAKRIPFIDTGIDIQKVNESLLASARITACTNGNREVIDNYISFAKTDNDIYQSNIQTADMNSFCALMAVIKWKKLIGFYIDDNPKQVCAYDTNDGEFKCE